jgi:hypothetical protein
VRSTGVRRRTGPAAAGRFTIIAATAIEERLIAYSGGDLDILEGSQSDMKRRTEHGLSEPNAN